MTEARGYADGAHWVSFPVAGIAVTQGSKIAGVNPHTGRAFVRESGGSGLTAWRHAVQARAQDVDHGGIWPWQGPVVLRLRFSVPRPASEPKTLRTFPIKARSGDLDKLARAVLDALTGVVYRDDAQVTELCVTKDFHPDGWMGVDIEVCCLPDRFKV